MREGLYPIIDVQPEWALEDEPMGSKEKFWVGLPGDRQPWLFKYSRVNAGVATGEHWAEKLAAEFADLLGIPHAEVELATFLGRSGCLSRAFDELADPTVDLVHGNELLAGMIDGYDREKHRGQHQHTLQNILIVFDDLMAEETEGRYTLLSRFGGFVVLDALILNTDRHHENWAMFRYGAHNGNIRYDLAPSFDHASSLARELTDNKLSSWVGQPECVARYARKGAGGIFLREQGRRGENPLRLAEMAWRRWPDYVSPWTHTIRGLGVEPLLDVIDRVPASAMRDLSRQFTRELVSYTHQVLEGLE